MTLAFTKIAFDYNAYPTKGSAYFYVEEPIIDTHHGHNNPKYYATKNKIKFVGEYIDLDWQKSVYKFKNNDIENLVPYDYKKSPVLVELPLEQGLDYKNMIDNVESNQPSEKSIVQVKRSPIEGKRYFHTNIEIEDKSNNDWKNWKYYTPVDKLKDVGEFTGFTRYGRESGTYNFLKDSKEINIWAHDYDGFIEYTPFEQGLSIILEHPQLYDVDNIDMLKDFLGNK
jgi:hypothetical protein